MNTEPRPLKPTLTVRDHLGKIRRLLDEHGTDIAVTWSHQLAELHDAGDVPSRDRILNRPELGSQGGVIGPDVAVGHQIDPRVVRDDAGNGGRGDDRTDLCGQNRMGPGTPTCTRPAEQQGEQGQAQACRKHGEGHLT